jgi:hypothetical protein
MQSLKAPDLLTGFGQESVAIPREPDYETIEDPYSNADARCYDGRARLRQPGDAHDRNDHYDSACGY